MAMYVLQALIKDLVQFTSGENASPSEQWTVQHSLRLLQQYPAGISKAVLLTELDYLWKTHQKRGEHVGKLKQATTTKQLSLADILTGDLTAIDEYRCSFSADGISCSMIMHRQWFDWMMFLQSVGVEAVNGRRCLLTQCRILSLSPPLLLPTPLSVFQLRLGDALEAFLVQDVFQMMHQLFASRFIDPHLRPLLPEAGGGGGARDTAQSAVLPQGLPTAEMPDNSETLVLCAEVLGSSAVRQYQTSASAGCGGAEYQVVTLRLRGTGGGGAGTAPADAEHVCIAYLILFDDQVALSRLWSKHDHLVLYRPYLRANLEEERLFGTQRPSPPIGSLPSDAAHRPDPALFEFLPATAAGAPLAFANYHLLYGSVTVVCKLESTTTPALSPPTRGNTTSPANLPSGAFFGTILSLRAVEGGTLPAAELWLQVSPPSEPAAPRLVRIRCSVDTLRCMCSGSVLLGPGALADLPLRAGQCVFVGGGVDVVSTSPLALLLGKDGRSNSQNDFQSSFGGDTLVFDGVCRALQDVNRGQSSQSDVFSAGADLDEIENVAGGNTAAQTTIVPLCSLPALACSPSLVAPVPLVQALKTFRTAGAGCLLVQASVQPMHPSVRLLPEVEAPQEAENVTERGVESSGKRQRCNDDADNMPPKRHVSGYQVMRLRDASGEVLCVLESRVWVSAIGDISAVRHCVVNTTSSLFFDAVSGQMTRAPPPPPATAAASATASNNPSGPARSEYAILLARVDDAAVDCPLLRHLRLQQAAAGRAALPIFRIETICDAQPICSST